jgi:hypothetical protein
MNYGDKNSQDDSKLEGKYANYFKIGHNAFEFVIDFGLCYTEDEEAKLHTRIITNPNYAKALLEILRESIEQYERNYGVIHKNDEQK